MKNPYSVASFGLVRLLIGLVVLAGELAYHIHGLLKRHHSLILWNGLGVLGGGWFNGPVLVPLYRPIPLGPLYGLTPLREGFTFGLVKEFSSWLRVLLFVIGILVPPGPGKVPLNLPPGLNILLIDLGLTGPVPIYGPFGIPVLLQPTPPPIPGSLRNISCLTVGIPPPIKGSLLFLNAILTPQGSPVSVRVVFVVREASGASHAVYGPLFRSHNLSNLPLKG